MELTIAQLSRPRVGEEVNGDAIVVRESADATMIALIDGLGHGPEAAHAAERATERLGHAPIDAPPAGLLEQVHLALSGTRGAAGLVCVLTRMRIRASGVGNVELRCLAGALSMPLNPGILGHRVRRHVELEGALTRGERIAVFSDGIAGRLDLAEHRHLDPDDACRAILERHGRTYDDASIVIIDVGA